MIILIILIFFFLLLAVTVSGLNKSFDNHLALSSLDSLIYFDLF